MMMNFNVLKHSAPVFLMFPQLAKLTTAAAEAPLTTTTKCHDQICKPFEEYCEHFEEICLPCVNICNPENINFESDTCRRLCSDYLKMQPISTEIHNIQMQQKVILLLLILLLVITSLHYTWKCINLLKRKRFVTNLMKKIKSKKENSTHAVHSNGKDLGGTTIQNMCAINDIERAPSHIYSLAGAEGSVMTTTTPISTRHPAENTTPSPQPDEYSYDNQALAVTPVSEKPNGAVVF